MIKKKSLKNMIIDSEKRLDLVYEVERLEKMNAL
jgi:hypothetical protein